MYNRCVVSYTHIDQAIVTAWLSAISYVCAQQFAKSRYSIPKIANVEANTFD